MLKPMLDIICKNFNFQKEGFIKTFYCLSLLSFIYFLPIIKIYTGIMDDYSWDIIGKTYSYENVRPFGTIVLSFLHFDPVVTFNKEAFIFTVGPLWQILSILCFCFASTIFGLWIFGNSKFSFFKSLAIFSIIANPCYLNLISYKTYCIVTTLSVCFALLSSINYQNRYVNIILGTLFLTTTLGLYQVYINIFFAASFLILLVKFKSNEINILNFIVDNSLKIIFSLLIYKFLIVANLDYINPYYTNGSKLISLDEKFWPTVSEYMVNYYKYNSHMFLSKPVVKWFYIISLISFYFTYVSSSKKRFSHNFIYFFSILGMLLSIGGCLLLMEQYTYLQRVFLASSISIFFLQYAYLNSIGKLNPALKFAVLIPILLFFYTSYGYASLLSSQKKSNHHTAVQLREDVFKVSGGHKHTVLYIGKLYDYTPIVNNTIYKDGVLYGLSYTPRIDNHWLSSIYNSYHGINAHNISSINDFKELIKVLCKKESLVKNPQYKIVKDEKRILVVGKEHKCFKSII